MAKGPKDIRTKSLPPLDWSPPKRIESLQTLVCCACDHAQEAADWYLRNKPSKRIGGRFFRLGAILLTAVAGVFPIFVQLWEDSEGKQVIEPAWASVLVAAAVLFIAIDRFFGFSSAWVRYITAEIKIRQARDSFEYEWQATHASFDGKPPTGDQVRVAITMIKSFTEQINSIVGNETAKWVAEFQKALRQIDEASQKAVTVTQPGSLAIVVENGAAVDPPGWELSLNSAPPTLYTGKTAAFTGLEPKDHVLRITAKIGSKPVQAEGVVQVKSGSISQLQMELT